MTPLLVEFSALGLWKNPTKPEALIGGSKQRAKHTVLCKAPLQIHPVGAHLFRHFVVHLEGPELKAGGELADGGQGEQELLSGTQRHVRVCQLGLLDLLLLLLGGDHGQNFLEDKGQGEGRTQKDK